MSPAARFVVIVLRTSLYFGLAILGWGGVAPFLSDPALMALAIVTCAIVAFFVGGSLSSGVREDRDNRWVLIAFAAIGISGGCLPACLDRIGFLTMDGEGVRWLGVAVYALGGLLRLWPVHVLGNRFSGLVAIKSGHTLVRNGIYGVIRHSSYLGLILNSLGCALAFRSWVGVALTVLVLVPVVARIRAVERFLRSEFGDAYDAYRAPTSRLIPGVY